VRDFIQLFAPHISTDQIVAASQSQIQADVDALFRDTTLPVRGACSGDASATD
jgi:hypothetical protein